MAGQFVIKQIAQEVISEVNQPLYIGGIDPLGSDSKLTIASNGNVSTATPLTVPSLTVNSKPVMSSLLASYTVTGSAVTSIDFSGLDINTHKSYRIEVEIYNSAGTAGAVSLFINSDTTATNYYSQEFSLAGTSPYYSRANSAQFSGGISASENYYGIGNLSRATGYAKCVFISSANRTTSSAESLISVFKTASVTNITQITFTANVANMIGVGSTIRLYRGDV